MTSNNAACNVYLPNAFETLIHENATDITFFIVCKMYFILALSKRWIQSKGCVRTCNDYVIGREINTVSTKNSCGQSNF